MRWVYRPVGVKRWQVGFVLPDGGWEPVGREYDKEGEAAARVHYLYGCEVLWRMRDAQLAGQARDVSEPLHGAGSGPLQGDRMTNQVSQLVVGVPVEEGPFRVQFCSDFIRLYGWRDGQDAEWVFPREAWAADPTIVPSMFAAVMMALLDPERFKRKGAHEWPAFQTKVGGVK